MKCEVKHNGDMGMGHLWLIMGGAFMAYNGRGIFDKVTASFGNMLKKRWSSGEYPFRLSHDHRFHSLRTPDLWTTTERAGPLPT